MVLLPWLVLGAEYLVLDLRMMFSWIWYHSFSLLHLQNKCPIHHTTMVTVETVGD